MVNKHTDLCTRAQALTLAEIGHPMHEIMAITNLARSTIYRYKSMARKRGYDPTINRILKDEYLVDDPRSERPSVLIEEQKKDLVTSSSKDCRKCVDSSVERPSTIHDSAVDRAYSTSYPGGHSP